jgi:hypothetical protein
MGVRDRESSWRCTCGSQHGDLPMSYRLDFPPNSYPAGSVKFERGGELARAGDDRFILANIELPRNGHDDEFVWTCWITLSQQSYARMQRLWDEPGRESQESAFGYLACSLPTYEPSTRSLKSRVHTRAIGMRPWVELEPTDHPLAVEQRKGIDDARIAAVFHHYEDQARR